MKIWKSTLTLLTLTALVAASVVIAGDKMDSKKAEMKGEAEKEMKAQVAIDKPAPDFTLPAADGKEYSLSDFEGKYVVLEWINFDCPFVKKHYHSGNIPGMQTEYTKTGDVVWFTVCSSAPGKQGYFSGKELEGRMMEEGWKASAYLIDADGEVGRMYGAKTTPHMYVIDTEGVLRYAGGIDNIPSTRVDDIDDATNFVRAALDNIMTDKAVATKTSTPYGCSVKYGAKPAKEASTSL